MKASIFFTFLLAAIFMQPAFSAEAEAKPKGQKNTAESMDFNTYEKLVMAKSPYSESKFNWPTEEEFKKAHVQLALIEEKRGPSSSSGRPINLKLMSAELSAFNETFLKINTPEGLDAFIVSENSKYDSYKSDDIKFAVAQVSLLKPLRGIVWKMIPVVDKSKAIHSFVLTFVKKLATDLSIILPTEQWAAGFEYITQPYAEAGKIANQFNGEADVQVFMATQVYKALETAIDRVSHLNFSNGEMIWDKQVFYGSLTFKDNRDRYRLIGELERYATLTALHSTAFRLALGRVFSAQNGVLLAKKLGNLYGWDGFATREVDGVTAQQKIKIYRQHGFASYGMKFQDGDKWAINAWNHLVASVGFADTTWEFIKARPFDESFAFSATLGNNRNNFNRGDTRIKNLKALVTEGTAVLHNHVTGDVAKVNLSAFFKAPPRDLKSFFGLEFKDQGPPEINWISKKIEVSPGNFKDVKYRNYFQGEPIAWNLELFKAYFPDLKKQEDIPKSARLLSESWGSWLILLPMMKVLD